MTFESYWNNPSFELFDPENDECIEKLVIELAKVTNFEQSKNAFAVFN